MERLTVEQVLRIHKAVTRLTVSAVDEHKLSAALDRPWTDVFGRELFPTIFDKAACLLHSIATTHPFLEDGNKRTAWVAADVLLKLNGYRLTASDDDGEDFVLGVVAHTVDVAAASRWLNEHSYPVVSP